MALSAEVIGQARIAVNALFRSMLYRRRRDSPSGAARILIIFQQALGDAVVLSGYLRRYVELFPQSGGYEITLFTRSSTLKLLKTCFGIPEEISVEIVDFSSFVRDYSYFKAVVSSIKGRFDLVIVPGTSLSAELLSCASDASFRIGLGRSYPVTWPPPMAAVYSRAYDRLWVPDRDSMMLERHAAFLRELGDEGAEALLPRALPKPRPNDLPEDYFVICPGASAAFKRWPADRFAEIARRVSEKTSWGVVLVGGAGEEDAARSVLSLIPAGINAVDLVGKTGFSEWSAVVQHARLVVGNDSATLHLAVAHSTPAVCIAGVYDKNQFFPYRVDRLREGERLPLTAMSDRPCAWCRTRGYFPGYGNKACARSIRSGGCAHCVVDVGVEEVLLCSERAVEKGFE